MPFETHEVLPHPSEPGLLELAPAVLDRLLCDDPISDHLHVEPQVFARGKYATVRRTHRTIRLANGSTRQEWYAAKYQRKQRRGTSVRHGILHEAAVLYLLRHEDHVVQLRGLYESSTEMILLLQLAPHGELQRLVDEAADGVGERVAQECVRHTLLALAAMHTRNLAHLDLKPQNLLLMAPPGPGCCVKLCDFGIAREMRTNVELREVLGTPDYVAPEVLQYEPISLATDMWSVGVLAYVLLSGHSPFAGDTKQETFLNITQGELDFPEDLFDDVSSTARDFIGALIQLNPQSRLSVKEALNHTWLSGFSSLPPTIPVGSDAPSVPTGETCSPVGEMGPRAASDNARLSNADQTNKSDEEDGRLDTSSDARTATTRLAGPGARQSTGDWVGRPDRPDSSLRADLGVVSPCNPPVQNGDLASLVGGSRGKLRPQNTSCLPKDLALSSGRSGVEEGRSKDGTEVLPNSRDVSDAAHRERGGEEKLRPLVIDTTTRTSPQASVSNNNEGETQDVSGPVPLECSGEAAEHSPPVCTSRATISLKCNGRPPATTSPALTPASKPKLPPKPNNLTSPGAVTPKKQSASKPPVARKPAIADSRPRSDWGAAARPVPCGVTKQTPSAQGPRTPDRARGSGSPSGVGGSSACVRRQKSNSPMSSSTRGSPQPSGGAAKGSPRLGRASRGSPQPAAASRNSPHAPELESPQLNKSSKGSPEPGRWSRESPLRSDSSSRSPQLSRSTNARGLHARSKEASPQPTAASRPNEGSSHKSSPVIGRKTSQSPSGSPARGMAVGSPSPSRRPFSSGRMSSESPPPYRKSWPGSSSAAGGALSYRPSRCRHSSSPSRDNGPGAPLVSEGAHLETSPTRHLSRRLQESPNRNCCRPRLEDSGPLTSPSLRTASPSPPRPTVCTRSPRAARSSFARNVEALHKGAPTNQPPKALLTSTGRVNVPSSPHNKSPDSPTCQEVMVGSPASRKTPSHSPPMFQPAPKKSNTVSDFFTTSCSLRARDCSEKSDGEVVPFSGIVDSSHARVGGPPNTPPRSQNVFKFNRYSLDAGDRDVNNKNTAKGTPGTRDRLPLHATHPKGAKPSQAPRQNAMSYDVRGAKPAPKPRPAHLTIKAAGSETLQCPPVSSCFAVFSSSSLSSPENSTHNSFSSSQSSGSLPSRQCLSPCSTSSSCSDFSFTKPWPDNAAPAPFSLKLQRDKENDRNALNSPTDSQKNLSWRADAAGDGRVALAVADDDSVMEVDPYSSLEGDHVFESSAVVVMRRDEDVTHGSMSHC